MTNEQLEEGQIVLCTVDKIAGTTVFVKIDENGEEGTITMSEIAPGRIRNLRDYVIPGKKIVCQILSIKEGRVQLSLRRVKPQERKELLDKLDREKSCVAILKTVLGQDSYEKTIEKIKEDYSIIDFFDKIKLDPKVLDKFIDKDSKEKILKILESKKEKQKEIKQIFKLSNKKDAGSVIVKNIIMESCKGTSCQVSYLAAGKYSITQKGEDFKGLKNEMHHALETIEKQAKKTGSEFSIEKN